MGGKSIGKLFFCFLGGRTGGKPILTPSITQTQKIGIAIDDNMRQIMEWVEG